MTRIEQIRSELATIQVETASGQWYVPPAIVQRMLSESVIQAAVAELDCSPDERLGLADDIHHRGIIIFALLIWLKRPNEIVRFRSHDCLDAKLPLSQSEVERVAPSFSRCFALEHQWEFIPFDFPEGMALSHRNLRDNLVVPFVRVEGLDKGSFSAVSRTWIPSTLQSFPNLRADDVCTKSSRSFIRIC